MASRGLRAVAAGLALVLATEAGAIYFFTQEKIDPAAMTSYNNEKAANAQVKRSLEAIKIAVKEDAQTYNYLISLLNSRPNECLFSKVTIGSAQTSKKDAKAFVRIKAHSRNQISLMITLVSCSRINILLILLSRMYSSRTIQDI